MSALALATIASGTHSAGTGPKKDLVAGTGTIVGFNDPQVHVNASRNPSTGEVHGHWFIRYPAAQGGLNLRGEVTCLDVELNNATVIGRIDHLKGEPPRPGLNFQEGYFVQIRVADNGEPGTLDRANFAPGSPTGEDFGGCLNAFPADLPLSQGNFIVHGNPVVELLSSLELLIAAMEAEAHAGE